MKSTSLLRQAGQRLAAAMPPARGRSPHDEAVLILLEFLKTNKPALSSLDEDTGFDLETGCLHIFWTVTYFEHPTQLRCRREERIKLYVDGVPQFAEAIEEVRLFVQNWASMAGDINRRLEQAHRLLRTGSI